MTSLIFDSYVDTYRFVQKLYKILDTDLNLSVEERNLLNDKIDILVDAYVSIKGVYNDLYDENGILKRFVPMVNN